MEQLKLSSTVSGNLYQKLRFSLKLNIYIPYNPSISHLGKFPTEMLIFTKDIYKNVQGFPDGAVVKNLPANAGDTGSIPGPGRSHMPRSN